MGSEFSSNAMATKAKAMYGNRLKPNDYQELLRRRNVPEIAGYLKNETYYHEDLEKINEHTIHRGYLELLIRQSYQDRFMKLLRYGDQGHSFYKYGVIQVEIRQILATLRSIKETEPKMQLAKTAHATQSYTTFDWTRLVAVTQYEQLAELLKPTMYYDVLKQLGIKSEADIDYTRCEIAFKNFFYEHVKVVIEKEFKGKDKEEIYSLFASQMELDNIAKIYRMKKYFQMKPEEIRTALVPNYHRIPKKTMEHWIDNYSAEEFLNAVRQSPYKSFMGSKEFLYIEYHMNAVKFNLSKHHMRFSNNPNMILISYLIILETELQNLIDIIEGIRYNVDADKISKLLIY